MDIMYVFPVVVESSKSNPVKGKALSLERLGFYL